MGGITGGIAGGIVGPIAGGSATGPVYDPDMMTLAGVGWYSDVFTFAGNKQTTIIRFECGASNDGSFKSLCVFSSVNKRTWLIVHDNDASVADDRGKLVWFVYNSSGVLICRMRSKSRVDDNTPHTLHAAFDGDNGTAVFYIDGVDADDTGWGNRVVPTVGTLDTVASRLIYIGSDSLGGLRQWEGNIGYLGHHNVYLTNTEDFYHPTNGLQEIDESSWTEWGSQPLFWNRYGTMTDNKGSAGNMTANGTITGPS